jgi:hypothetical protein
MLPTLDGGSPAGRGRRWCDPTRVGQSCEVWWIELQKVLLFLYGERIFLFGQGGGAVRCRYDGTVLSHRLE